MCTGIIKTSETMPPKNKIIVTQCNNKDKLDNTKEGVKHSLTKIMYLIFQTTYNLKISWGFGVLGFWV